MSALPIMRLSGGRWPLADFSGRYEILAYTWLCFGGRVDSTTTFHVDKLHHSKLAAASSKHSHSQLMAMTMNTTDDFDHPDADAQDCGRKQSNHVIARSSLLFRLVFWIAVIVVAASQAQAFVVVTPSSSPHWTKLSNKSFQHRSIVFAQHNDEHETSQHASNFAHSDIEWRLRPPEGTSRFNRLKVKLGAQILRLDCKLKGERLPSVLCPRGGRALLEAYYKGKKLILCMNNSDVNAIIIY